MQKSALVGTSDAEQNSWGTLDENVCFSILHLCISCAFSVLLSIWQNYSSTLLPTS